LVCGRDVAAAAELALLLRRLAMMLMQRQAEAVIEPPDGAGFVLYRGQFVRPHRRELFNEFSSPGARCIYGAVILPCGALKLVFQDSPEFFEQVL